MASNGKRVVVYYQTQFISNGDGTLTFVSPLPLVQYATHLIVAAFHINTNPQSITLNDTPPDDHMYDEMWQIVRSMQARGVKALGMLGGAAAGSYRALNADFDTYYPLLSKAVKFAGLDGLDLDVEENTSLDLIVKLIKQLKADFGDDFIITLAPVASALTNGADLSGFSYINLENNHGDLVSWYNAQFYSGFGTTKNDTGYLRIVQHGNNGSIFPANKVVAGTLTNQVEGNGFVPIDDVVKTLDQLVGILGSNFGGVAGWEYYNSLPGGVNNPAQWAMLMRKTLDG